MSTPFAESLEFYSDWRTIAIAAAVISVMGSSLLIMLSRLFSLRNLEQIAKTEFVYAASTVLIVVMVVTVVNAIEPMLAGGSTGIVRCLYLSSFINPDTGEPLPCTTPGDFTEQQTLIDWVKLYMETPANCVKEFMQALYVLSIPVEAFASIFIEVFMSEQASGFGVKWLAERIKNTTMSLTFYVYIYYLIIHILDFVKYYAGFFFSIGVVLRAFPPTRGAGAYLMAISFGLYFVFPLTYVLVASMSMPHAQATTVQLNNPDVPVIDGNLQYTCLLPDVPDIDTYACDSASLGTAAELPSRIRANADALEDMLTFRLTDFVRHLISAICLFPLIAMVVLFTFVLNTTNLFGGNIPEIGRGLVKLI
ncbi:hypothetical protein GF318_03055 [Candidatus Micrarchaeota archaeon]|nr:hypothetical protein [Candidatus Micrarchaeota archaeon]